MSHPSVTPPTPLDEAVYWVHAPETSTPHEVVSRQYAEQLWAEIERLRGITPELPPREPDGEGLPRYGLRWNGPASPLAAPLEDGYWTPWHLAAQALEACSGPEEPTALEDSAAMPASMLEERSAFERFILTERGEAYLQQDEGQYSDLYVQEAWEAWEARARAARAARGGYVLPAVCVEVLVRRAQEVGVEQVTFGIMKPGAGPRGLPDYYGVICEEVSRLRNALIEHTSPGANPPVATYMSRQQLAAQWPHLDAEDRQTLLQELTILFHQDAALRAKHTHQPITYPLGDAAERDAWEALVRSFRASIEVVGP